MRGSTALIKFAAALPCTHPPNISLHPRLLQIVVAVIAVLFSACEFR